MTSSRRATTLRWLGYTASGALVAWLLLVVLPQLGDPGEAGELLLERLSSGAVALVAIVLAAYVLTHAMTLQVATPPLALGAAALIRIICGGISRMVPAGWAMATGTLAGMLRGRGVRGEAITHAIAVTGVWNTLTKLSLPLVGLVAIAITGRAASADALLVAVAATAAILVTLVGLWVLTRVSVGQAVGRSLRRPVAAIARKLGRDAPPDVVKRIVELQDSTTRALRRRPLAMGSWYYAHHLTQAALVWIGMRVAAGPEGLVVGWPEVLTAFALGYLLTGLPISPGGLGTLDVAVLAVLVSLGEDPAVSSAGLVVYRISTYGLHAAALVAWPLWRSHRRDPTAQPSARA